MKIIKGDTPKKIICYFDERGFNEKPKNNEIGAIKNRIQDNAFSTYKNIEEIKNEILEGKTCIPGAIKGNENKNWQKQQIFMLDIDNKEENQDINIEDERHITVEKALEICREHSLEPSLIYNTFSHSERQHKFRLVYIFEKEITDRKIAKEILKILHKELKELNIDTSKKNLSDIFFAGKDIAYISNNFYKVEEMNTNQEENIEDLEKNIDDIEREDEKEEEPQQMVEVEIDGINYNYLISPPYVVLGDSIFKETDKAVEKISHVPVYITSVMTNLDNGEEKLELAIKKKDKWKKGIFLKSQVYNGTLAELANFGIPVNSLNNKDFIKYLSNLEADNEDNIPAVKTVSKLGWRNNKFIPFSDDSNIKVDMDYRQTKWINAYSPKGTLEEWIEAMKTYRENNIFRFMMAASFAAPLISLIGHRIFIVFNWGNSRAGKTSALKAALSVWGNPEDLTLTFNTTAVGIERLAGLYNDLPLGLDEKSINKSQTDIEKIIYMLGNGISRIRGNKTGGVQTINTWNTVVLSTGEETISTENSRTGVQTRTLEIEGSPYNYDEKKASKMYGIVGEFYGTAGPFYINKLIEEYGQDNYKTLKEEFRNVLEKVGEESNNDISSYISSVSIVTLADILIGKWLFNEGKEKSFEMAKEILIGLDKSKEIDIVDKCHDYIESWLLSNHRYFDTYLDKIENDTRQDEDDLVSTSKARSFGIYEKNIYYVHSSILIDKLKSAGYSSRKIISEFGKRGYIITTEENGKLITNTVQKKFRGKNARMYAFPVDEAEEVKEQKKEKLREEEEFALRGTTAKMKKNKEKTRKIIEG